MSFIEDFKSLIHNDYKLGVKQTTKETVVYINPNKFDLEHRDTHGYVSTDDVEIIKDMLDKQIPGLSQKYTDVQLMINIHDFLDMGPLVIRENFNGQKICIINEIHDEFANKNGLGKDLARSHSSLIKHVPGHYDTWERAVGIHEGDHCEQTHNGRPLSSLLGEAESDQKTYDWLEQNGYKKIAQAHTDYRALGAATSGDLAHSTGIFTKVGENNVGGLNELRAAESYGSIMMNTFGEHILNNHTPEELAAIKALSPEQVEQFIQKEVQTMLANGAFKNDNPYIEKFISEAINAYFSDDSDWIEPEQAIIDAEKSFNGIIIKEVQNRLGEGEFASKLKFSDPERFSKILEEARKDGAFKNDNPYTERYIDHFIDAYRRQVIEAKPDPTPPHHKRASLDETSDNQNYAQTSPNNGQSTTDILINFSDDIGTSMKIDGVNPSAYFASFADPEMATARLEQKAQAPMFAAQQPQPASSPP